MAIQGCGNRLEDFTWSGAAVTESTVAKTTFVPNTIRLGGAAANYLTLKLDNSITTCWPTFYVKNQGGGDGYPMISWLDGATEFARIIYKNATDGYVLQTKISAAWTDLQVLGAVEDFHTIMAAQKKLTFELVVHESAGVIGVYTAVGEIARFTSLDTTGDETITGVTDVRFWGHDNSAGNYSYYCEMIVAEDDSRDYRLAPIAINAAGTTSDFTGTYTDVNDPYTEDPDVDNITSTAANEISTYAADDLPATALEPLAVAVMSRARTNGTGPQNLQHAVRTNANNYFSGNLALTGGYVTQAPTFWQTNPNTAAAWTQAEVDAIEIGVKSIA